MTKSKTRFQDRFHYDKKENISRPGCLKSSSKKNTWIYHHLCFSCQSWSVKQEFDPENKISILPKSGVQAPTTSRSGLNLRKMLLLLSSALFCLVSKLIWKCSPCDLGGKDICVDARLKLKTTSSYLACSALTNFRLQILCNLNVMFWWNLAQMNHSLIEIHRRFLLSKPPGRRMVSSQ